MSAPFLFFAAFIASTVEMVEALTIVLAVGVTRGWRSALIGVGAGFAALAVIVAAFGPALTFIPIGVLRLVVGGLLLAFGLQWLRKAILRASGYMALHDEDRIFQRDVEEFRSATSQQVAGMDWYGFTLSFKGVLLEGLEVAFIVITFGSAARSKNGVSQLGLATVAAASAFVIVALVGAIVHKPLSRVPENTMKFSVGIMLTTFGIFWGAEGAGADWPGNEVALLGVLAFVLLFSLALVPILRKRRTAVTSS